MPDRPARARLAQLVPALAWILLWPWPASPQTSSHAVSPQGAAARSLVLPGWGQLELDQRRGWAYALAEVTLWVVWADRRAAGRDVRDQYRDFAWETGRIRAGARVDGPFAYYETLTKWVRSGAYDADPGLDGVQPEEDPSTFNGSIWARARGLFLPSGTPPDPNDPGYGQALDYYRSRAYGSEFLWDWSGRDEDQQALGSLIARSDERFRQATAALGAVLANHMLSGVDAFVSARLRATSTIRLAPPSEPSGRGWSLWLRLDGLP